ncbi:MAG: DUF6270 domain-containing protein [Phenylobacterium sp.]|uniref:DUF6270 domain-containing protein n=1 Tax=Phenylobacterium sp. TaxID=1871053 RepID=UPI003BB64D5C
MARVAIIGSCITRDLWPILGEAPADLLYISRTSLPSLFARPLAGVELADDPPPGLARHQHNALRADLKKSALAALIAHRPTHLIFDFIDERFDLLAVRDTLVTHSWELEVSGYLDQPAFSSARIVPRASAQCDQLWREAALETAAFLSTTPLSDARIILHESQWAGRYLDLAGQLQDFDPDVMIFDGNVASLDAHNALLRSYQQRFAELTGAARVSADPGLMVGDVGHRWGLSPFHYVADYYRDIWGQLRALGL